MVVDGFVAFARAVPEVHGIKDLNVPPSVFDQTSFF